MKANELRIGNLVLNNSCICEILHIHGGSFIGCVLKTKQGNEISAYYELLESIKLTEDWLSKFGFEKGYIGYYFIGDFIISVEGQIYFGETETWIAEIHFVHQLQNLYYALIGEELSLSGI